MWLFVCPTGKTQAEFRQCVDELFYVFILVLIRKKKKLAQWTCGSWLLLAWDKAKFIEVKKVSQM